jgi:hypothetical protein
VSRLHRVIGVVAEETGFAAGGVNWRTLATVLCAYAVLTLVFTHPVVLSFLSQPAGSTDVYEYMWELWWAKRSLIDLQISPANVTALYHPYGAYHPLLLLDAYLMLTSLPVVMLFSPAAAINFHLLTSYILTGFTTYLLCYHLTRRHWPAFIGGAVFAFSPFRADRAAHGVISMALTYWLPLYVLFLIRLFELPRMRNGVFCGIALGFSILSSFLHFAHFVVPLTVVFLAYQLFANRRRLFSTPFLKGLALALGLGCAVALPVYLPLLGARLAGELDYFSRFGVLSHSAALLSFIVPPSFHVILGQVEPLAAAVRGLLPGRYYVVYVGVVVPAIALVGLVLRRVRIWWTLALVSGVLALGPLLHVTRDLTEVTIGKETGFVLMPGALLMKLPFYEWARGPARFAELTIFSLAVAASYGVLVIIRRLRRPVLRLAVLGGLLALLLLDYAVFVPFPTQDVTAPVFYQIVQADGGDYGVLDTGTESFNHEGMYYQTIHQHSIARGFIYRYPSGSHYYQEFLEQLMNSEDDIVNAGQRVPILRKLGIELVVLHKSSDTIVAESGPFLSESLGEPVYEDEQIVAFAAPTSDASADERPLLMLGAQWHPLEVVEEVPSRWMVNDGELYVRVDSEGAYELELTAHPFGGPRHLQVFVGEALQEEYHVGGMQQYVTSPFALPRGEWTAIRLHVPEGCEVPSETAAGQDDDRCLSMLFQQVDVVPIGVQP